MSCEFEMEKQILMSISNFEFRNLKINTIHTYLKEDSDFVRLVQVAIKEVLNMVDGYVFPAYNVIRNAK